MGLPRCPKCGSEGSTSKSKFCRLCGAFMVQIEWNDGVQAVQFRYIFAPNHCFWVRYTQRCFRLMSTFFSFCVMRSYTENDTTTLHSPFEEAITEQYVRQGQEMFVQSSQLSFLVFLFFEQSRCLDLATRKSQRVPFPPWLARCRYNDASGAAMVNPDQNLVGLQSALKKRTTSDAFERQTGSL